jgi:sialidase-1
MRSEQPSIEQMYLFAAAGSAYATYRIPCLVATPRGAILAAGEARRTARGDWGSIDILFRRSVDGGATWSAPQCLSELPAPVPKNPVALGQGLATADEQTCNNPVFIVEPQTGVIHFLFGVEYCRCYTRRSEDDGATWSAPREITATLEAFRAEYDWRVFATGPGHSISLRNGRLVVPVWLSTGTGGHGHRPSCVAVIYSDDHGETWQRGEVVVRHSEELPNPSETVALQCLDGRLMLNMRSESPRHRRLQSWSADGATGWSSPTFAEALFEPVCCASLVRLSGEQPGEASRILFANPDSQSASKGPNEWGAWPRENLTVRLSEDEGASWPVSRVLAPGIAGYSDLAVGPDGAIYCLYEGGGVGGDMFHNATLTLARFNLAWLRNEHSG